MSETNSEGYKEVQLGPRQIKIPDTWEKTQLGELGEYLNGYAFKSSNWSDQGRPIIRIQNLTNSAGEETNYYEGEMNDRYIVEYGDLLVSWSATLGVYIWDGPEALLNQHIFKVIPSGKVIDDFLYFLLDHNLDLLEMRVQGSTMKHIRKSTFEDTFVALPPLSEQGRIAEILSVVDEQIQQTDEIIEATKELKRGLMQDLLTGGHLDVERVAQNLGPKTYRIPEHWDVSLVSDTGEIITGNTPKTENKDNFGGKYPFITPADLGENKIVEDTKRTVTQNGLSEVRDVPAESVLVVCIGSTIGKLGLTGSRSATNQQINTIVTNSEYLSEYVYYALHLVTDVLLSRAGTTATPIVNKTDFSSIPILSPPISDQKHIAEILSTVDEKIASEKENLTNLREIKRGLMQDLLTGKVRVNID